MLYRLFAFLALFCILAVPAWADFEIGRRAYENKDWIRAITELRPLAEKGDPRALVILGHMYNDGNGVIKDPTRAVEHYIKAAAQDHVEAVIAMGAMAQSGLGLQQNTHLANVWFERAAKLGDARGMFLTAITYMHGDKTGKTAFHANLPQAYKWFLLAHQTADDPKIRRAAQEMAEGVGGQLRGIDITATKKLVADFTPTEPGGLGPLPSAEALPKPNQQKDLTETPKP
ncbi:MAG: tetratricopeptide repeat protein [Alphaproteobacteria bacterium]|nr:tetratricopeptide repeat protein [Alphaproteobacteria bacterium]